MQPNVSKIIWSNFRMGNLPLKTDYFGAKSKIYFEPKNWAKAAVGYGAVCTLVPNKFG